MADLSQSGAAPQPNGLPLCLVLPTRQPKAAAKCPIPIDARKVVWHHAGMVQGIAAATRRVSVPGGGAQRHHEGQHPPSHPVTIATGLPRLGLPRLGHPRLGHPRLPATVASQSLRAATWIVLVVRGEVQAPCR